MYCTCKNSQKTISIYFKHIISAFTVLLLATNINAQRSVIKGKLVDEKLEPISFASVYIKGTTMGVQTNETGTFILRYNFLPVTIVCSALGYETVEKKLTKSDFKDSIADIKLVLNTKKSTLEEVVVVGYGIAKKMDFTSSSTSTITASALSGKVSGVSISGDKSTKIRLRGASTIIAKTESKKIYDSDKLYFDTTTKTNTTKQIKLLTAGELNDFKKWTMWEDYSNTDFKTHSEKWDLNVTHRYSVQLQNNNLKAVIGQLVYLVDKTVGDTLWTAVTDNTGKAELWNGFSNNKKNDVVIAVANEPKQFPAIPFTQGINSIVINKNCTVSNKVEIAFVVDATGSMQDEISYLKEELEDILTKISKKDASLNLNTGVVFYRDNGDAYVTKLQQLSSGIKNTIDFIKQQNADGGGDYPEALKEGLEDAIEKLTWSDDARTKIIFLLMDAPPHNEAKTAMAKLISNAAAKGIRIVPVACSGTDKATEFIMRSMALATNGTYLFLTDDSGIGNVHIKPTTDEFKVELLNVLLQRVIEQMCFVQPCEEEVLQAEPLTIYENTEKLKVYPNPTEGPITIKYFNNLKEIFVADFTGKLLMRYIINNKKSITRIDLSNFPSGTYFIKYITDDNKMGAEKVILMR
jgi:hypothetical protein